MTPVASAKDVYTNAGSSGFVTVVKSVLKGYIISAAAIIVLACAIVYTSVPEGVAPAAVTFITVLGVAVTGLFAAKRAQSKGWLTGAAAGLMYVVLLYIAGMLVFRNFSIGWNLILLLVIGFLAGAFGGIVGINLKHKRR